MQFLQVTLALAQDYIVVWLTR